MHMDIRLVVLLGLLLPATALQAQSEEPEPEEKMRQSVYAEGGETLYCREKFGPGEEASFNRVYREDQIVERMDCGNRLQCRSNESYQEAMSDLHNLYPVARQVLLDRRGTQFGELGDDVKVASENCPYQLSFQTFDPPEHARGNVARVMFYMHTTHDLPLIGSLKMYKRWNEEDPPDEAEKTRNDAIEAITGQRNPYIDDPSKADELESPSYNRLRFGG